MQRSMVRKRKSNFNWRLSLSATMTGAPPSPQLFFETANAFQRTEALKTAIELELFTAIAEGKQTAEDIGARCKASARSDWHAWSTIHGLPESRTECAFLARTLCSGLQYLQRSAFPLLWP